MSIGRFGNSLKTLYKDQAGITGLETAIILIAFIVVAAVFAFTIMTTGLFSTEKAKTTAQAGITEASSTFVPKGAVVAKCGLATTTPGGPCVGAFEYVSEVVFQLTLAAGAEEASLESAALAFVYTDDNQRHSYVQTVPITDTSGLAHTSTTDEIIRLVTISKIVGISNDLLKKGEVAEITVFLNRNHDLVADTELEKNSTFRIEVIPPTGGSLLLERKTPVALSPVMNLE